MFMTFINKTDAYMTKTDAHLAGQDALLQSQAASLRNLETQMGQIAQTMNNRPLGTLPSDTINNPKGGNNEQCKAITLKSGKEIEGNPKTKFLHQEVEHEREENIEKVKVDKKKDVLKKEENKKVEKPFTIPLPFPNRPTKQKLDAQFQKFLEVFKKLHINIPFAEALEQMPSYVKFMKDILSKKRKLGDFETVALTEECSAILQNKLPPKLKDPGSFTIPCHIGTQFSGRALCDLGAGINLMPLSIFQRLGLGECKPTTVTLQLADRSFTYPRGVVEDVLVKVDKFIFPADFIILDMEEDRNVPLILGRPFLATGRTLIDVQKGELTMRVQDQQVTFNIFKAIEVPHEYEECSYVSILNHAISDVFHGNHPQDPLALSLTTAFEHVHSTNDVDYDCVKLLNASPKLFRSPQLEPLELPSSKASLKHCAHLGAVALPLIISSIPTEEQVDKLLYMLKDQKQGVDWAKEDICCVSPTINMKKILLEGDHKASIEHQWCLSPIMSECVPKMEGMTIVSSGNRELILICNTRLKLPLMKPKFGCSSPFLVKKEFSYGAVTHGDPIQKSTHKVNSQWLELNLGGKGITVWLNENYELILIFSTRHKLFLMKLKIQWPSPIFVVQESPQGVVSIEDPNSKSTFKVNSQRLKLYVGGEVDCQKTSLTLANST